MNQPVTVYPGSPVGAGEGLRGPRRRVSACWSRRQLVRFVDAMSSGSAMSRGLSAAVQVQEYSTRYCFHNAWLEAGIPT